MPSLKVPYRYAWMFSQVLEDARAVDDAFTAGKDIKPLCGLAFAVKDNIDVLGCVLCRVLHQTLIYYKPCGPESLCSTLQHSLHYAHGLQIPYSSRHPSIRRCKIPLLQTRCQLNSYGMPSALFNNAFPMI